MMIKRNPQNSIGNYLGPVWIDWWSSGGPDGGFGLDSLDSLGGDARPPELSKLSKPKEMV